MVSKTTVTLSSNGKYWQAFYYDKTGRRRVVPIEPKLYEYLHAAFKQTPKGEERVCPVSRHSLWRNFQKIRSIWRGRK